VRDNTQKRLGRPPVLSAILQILPAGNRQQQRVTCTVKRAPHLNDLGLSGIAVHDLVVVLVKKKIRYFVQNFNYQRQTSKHKDKRVDVNY
jgi:hypothetical protein